MTLSYQHYQSCAYDRACDTMCKRHELVPGGGRKYICSDPPTYLTHTIPTIHEKAIIIAATHPNIQTGSQRTWLTAARPDKLLERWGNYMHGSPKADRKIVLIQHLLQHEITPVTIVEPGKMIDRFLEEIRAASLRAKAAQCPLLLFVFCHGIEGHSLILDNGQRNKGLSITRVKVALEPGASVTLFTTACYSGGWAVSPDLNITSMCAASGNEQSVAWVTSTSVGRACGSIFAGATIAALSKISTPLLTRNEGVVESLPNEAMDLQPEDPTDVQTET
ncbi:hypothetical protein B0H63DRAFT_559572 [Podospora didyma]|uniref:Uncharacterized protein n=1 Tax=Podospora didyma TaxID=330526 RepID=A0AAE0TZ29_9PEZI|nr:hypothetical protein B0H63DRAFT_559572 [Podospora didyma]